MKTNLQKKREDYHFTVDELAEESMIHGDCGSFGHMVLTIKSIEKERLLCPKPRKTYEWDCLAKGLNCSIEHIYISFS